MPLPSFQWAVHEAAQPARYHGGPFRRKPTLIVVHATAGDYAAGAISWLNRVIKNGEGGRASYHYLIDRGDSDATKRIIRFLHPTFIAYHAGKSWWPTAPKPHQSVNSWSLGVSFANDNGSDDNLADDPLTEWQSEAGLWLVVTLCQLFGIPATNVVAHREVSPGRKTDPLPRILSMPAFRQRVAEALTA